MQGKRKIALISFHNAANYGAALQAVALQKKLDSLGYPNEYIDYQNSHRRHSYDMAYLFRKALKCGRLKDAIKYAVGFPFMYLRKSRFSKFYKKHLRITPTTYSNSKEAAELNPKYDKFIVGSDQVWNPENNGHDMAFLLDFVDDCKKVSYSSSFGISSIPQPFLTDYRTLLQKFRHLAVRESDGVRIVKELTGRTASLVLDPVFLIDREEWIGIGKRVEGDFVFSYTNRSGQFENFLKTTGYTIDGKMLYKLARQTSPADFLNPKVKVKYAMSPEEFIGVINSAELVVSASFHCISLAIILNRPFIAILTGDKGKDERLTSILGLLNLNSRIFNEQMTMDQVLAPIDYNSVNIKLNKLRSSSIDYLISSIEN